MSLIDEWASNRVKSASRTMVVIRPFAFLRFVDSPDRDPYPEGFLTTKTGESVGLFHDGKAAFHLQAGAWVVGVGRSYAANKQGLPDGKLGWFFFPEVQGGEGKANDIFSSVYG
jgi:hypothetical protein